MKFIRMLLLFSTSAGNYYGQLEKFSFSLSLSSEWHCQKVKWQQTTVQNGRIFIHLLLLTSLFKVINIIDVKIGKIVLIFSQNYLFVRRPSVLWPKKTMTHFMLNLHFYAIVQNLRQLWRRHQKMIIWSQVQLKFSVNSCMSGRKTTKIRGNRNRVTRKAQTRRNRIGNRSINAANNVK